MKDKVDKETKTGIKLFHMYIACVLSVIVMLLLILNLNFLLLILIK